MRRRFVTIGPDESLLEAHQLMRLARLRYLVVAYDGHLLGMISFLDLQMRILDRLRCGELEGTREYLASVRVRDSLVHPAERATPDTSLEQAAAQLIRFQIACLPVAEDTPNGPHLLGLITETDLLRAAYGEGSAAGSS